MTTCQRLVDPALPLLTRDWSGDPGFGGVAGFEVRTVGVHGEEGLKEGRVSVV